jgi:hypothetical protein
MCVYLDILELDFVPLLEKLQLLVIFQHHDRPPHWSNNVQTFLDETFHGICIGNDGSVLWPRHFPEIKPLDFSLWRYVTLYLQNVCG